MNVESMETQLNKLEKFTYDYTTLYGNLFAEGLFRSGIIKDVTPEQLQGYFANPDTYQDVIYDIANYYYVINAEIHQLFELIESLPKLNYALSAFERDGVEDKNIIKLKRALHEIDHKRLTRDILKQTASYGNVVGVWLGKGMETYPYIFSDLCYVKNAYRTVRGKWQLVISADIFYQKHEYERDSLIKEFKPLLTIKEYNDLINGDLKEFLLPLERTICIGTGKLNRNQFIGTSWITPVMFDVLHKRKLKDVEQTIANTIINAVAVLTLGSFEGKEKDNSGGNLARDYNKIPDKLISDIHNRVKNSIKNGAKEGMSLVTLPNFAKMEFPKVSSDGLDGGKFNQTNSDITKGLGISGTTMNGEGANYNSAKLNLEIFYTKLGVMLEEIEYAYQLMFNLVLPSKYKNNYYLTYAKDMPLPVKERLQHLKGLYDKGWSARTYIQELGYDFDVLLAETKEELNLEINKNLIPPPTSYTQPNDTENNGRPKVDDNDTESENTIRTRETQG